MVYDRGTLFNRKGGKQMDTKYKKLVVFILGLVEIIAGFAMIKSSTWGGITFIILGLVFFIVMFIINMRANDPRHPYMY